MDTIALKRTFVRLQIKESAAILATSVILPFLIHLIPLRTAIPLGMIFLPMFYAPFIAVVFLRPHVAVVAGLLAPILNSLLTGSPTQEKLLLLTLELVLFSLLSSLIQRRWKHFWGTAAVAYLAAVLVLAGIFGRINSYLNTITISLPGIMMLVLLNIFLLRFQSNLRR